jgi:hypothetical protein
MNPSEISNLTLTFDLEKAVEKFRANPSRNFIQMGAIKQDGAPVVVNFNGLCNSDKIYSSLAFEKNQFSIPMQIDQRAEMNALFEKLAKLVQDKVPEWGVTNPLDREEFWLRLNFDQRTKKFKTTSNLGFTTVKSAEKFTGLKDREINAIVEVKAWFNIKDEKAGVSLNVVDIIFQ